jgi:hypothetical protein
MEFWTKPANERRTAALRLWSEFPVGQVPRPVVLIGSRVSSGGFETGAVKLAFLSGAIDVCVDVSVGVVEALPRRRSPFQGSTITVTAAIAEDAEFETDRGMQLLPAWRLTITGMEADCLVLDPDCRGWWPRGVDGERLRQAGALPGFVAVDDVSVEVHVGLVCAEDLPTIEFTETQTAVLYDRAPPDPGLKPTFGLLTRRVSATLPSPLGNRVLIDGRGVPTVVHRMT